MRPPLLVTVLVLLGVLAAAAPAHAIVGGQATTVEQTPWQVAVFPGEFLCGGSVLDETHVVTAAHCAFDDTGAPIPASEIQVLAGASRIDGPSPSDLHDVGRATLHPAYDDSALIENDAAVLELSEPLDLRRAGIAPVALGGDDRLALWDGVGTDTAIVSGWGRTSTNGPLSLTLLRTTIPVRTDGACGQQWGSGFRPRLMLCGGTSTADTCQGDSGGPAVVLEDDRPVLAGITSFGRGCADERFPGVYTEVAGVRSFVEPTSPAPRRVADPTLTGTAQVGETLTCGHGRWTGSPALGFEFLRADVTPAQVLPSGGSRRYVLRAADEGIAVGCRVTAATAAGSATGTSAALGPVAAAPPGTQPQPQPEPPPEPQPQPQPQPEPRPQPEPQPLPPAPPADRTAPRARVTRLRCSASRCTFRLRATDPAPASGVRIVEARLRRTVLLPCRRAGRRTRCPRSTVVRLRPRTTARGTRVVVLARPRGGISQLVVVAVDGAGNRGTAVRRTVPRRTR